MGLYAPYETGGTLRGDTLDSRRKTVITSSSDFTKYLKFYEVTKEYDPPTQENQENQEKREDMRFRKVNTRNRQRNLSMPSKEYSKFTIVHQTKRTTNLRRSYLGGISLSKT